MIKFYEQNVGDMFVSGFEQDIYDVNEGDGFVTVCVSLSGSTIERPLTFSLSTMDGNAQGLSIGC